MSCSDFEIQLAKEVRRFPNLYKSKDTRRNKKYWIQIARNVSKGKKEINISFCRKAWRRLRDNYAREHKIKITSRNSSVGPEDPEILQELDWLGPFIKHKTQPTQVSGGEILTRRRQGETGGSRGNRFTPLSTHAADSTFTPPVTTHTRPFRPTSTLTKSGDGPSSSKPSSSSTSGPAQPRKRTHDRVDQASSKDPKKADNTREHRVSSMGGSDDDDGLLGQMITSQLRKLPPELKSQAKSEIFKLLSVMEEMLSQT